MKLYQEIANLVNARQTCIEKNNTEWLGKHTERAESLCKELLPSGSGFDSGTTINWEASKPNKLVFSTSFHHMTDAGYYNGWTTHEVTCIADLAFGYRLTVGGQNKNDIKDYIHDCFHSALEQEVSPRLMTMNASAN